jgi:hypothetical protein
LELIPIDDDDTVCKVDYMNGAFVPSINSKNQKNNKTINVGIVEDHNQVIVQHISDLY